MHSTSLRRIRNIAASLAFVSLVAACGSSSDTAAPATSAPSTTVAGTGSTVTPSTTATTVAGGAGWIGGEPDWTAAPSAGGDVVYSASAADAPLPAADGAPADRTAAEAIPSGDVSEAPQDGPGLRAGSVDDNADYTAYLEYLGRAKELGVTTREFDPAGRIVVTVTGSSGLPVDGASVDVSAGGAAVATIRTTADGTARFLPALYGQGAATSFTFTVGAASADAAPNGTVALTTDLPGGAAAPVPVDVLFLLDATGSMGDEIDRLKTTIDSVAERIAGLEAHPDVRFGMTLYRDLDDAFVTTTFDFTADVAAFHDAIDDVVADGGGDYPEAMDEGLADALSKPTWRDPASTVQLVFLVADAPPQVARDVQVPYTDSVLDAISRGIKIIPIASSESDDQAEAVFRQIAAATGGRFVFLSYGAAGAATGPSTDIESTDYEELALDDLVVRLVSEELAHLTGAAPGETVPPTDPTTPPTNPPGQ